MRFAATCAITARSLRRVGDGTRGASNFSKSAAPARGEHSFRGLRRFRRRIIELRTESHGVHEVERARSSCRPMHVVSRFSNSETGPPSRSGHFVGDPFDALAQWLQLLDIPEKVPMASAGGSVFSLANFIR
jgi:hypothetical protein